MTFATTWLHTSSQPIDKIWPRESSRRDDVLVEDVLADLGILLILFVTLTIWTWASFRPLDSFCAIEGMIYDDAWHAWITFWLSDRREIAALNHEFLFIISGSTITIMANAKKSYRPSYWWLLSFSKVDSIFTRLSCLYLWVHTDA